jgi:hypothetical protein
MDSSILKYLQLYPHLIISRAILWMTRQEEKESAKRVKEGAKCIGPFSGPKMALWRSNERVYGQNGDNMVPCTRERGRPLAAQ